MLVYQENIRVNTKDFCQGIIGIASELAINPNWLMTFIYQESRFNHLHRNIETGGFGLIQLDHVTCRKTGFSVKKLEKMSNVSQLELVHDYLIPFAPMISNYAELCMSVIYPRAIGQPKEFLLGKEEQRINSFRTEPFYRSFFGKKPRNDQHHYISKAEMENWLLLSLPNAVECHY